VETFREQESGLMIQESVEDALTRRAPSPIDGHLAIDGHQRCDTLCVYFPGFLHRWPSGGRARQP
jgi:hypothetical protein